MQDERYEQIAHGLLHARDVLYIGRGPALRSLSRARSSSRNQLHPRRGYAAGELKHGPIALIDEDVPVIVVAPPDRLFEKTASNLPEVIARGGKVILLSNRRGCQQLGDFVQTAHELPEVDPLVAPILYAIPVQLLAYHTAVLKGTDVDQPRNLARSVTVE